ncbi:MAG TPA: sugar ABC transporter permease [Candidatus Dormibacteraeota bacterium]|jgi:multiple sugar transport system permease protein
MADALTLSRTGGQAAGRSISRPAAATGMLVPFGVLYLLFLVLPSLYALVMSFFQTSLVRPGLSGFAGLDNYRELLTSTAFWASVAHTILFTVFTTPPLVLVALLLALLADRVRRARWVYRLVFFAPYVLPSSVVFLVFSWMYTPGFGLIDGYLGRLGATPIPWLTEPRLAMAAVVLMTVWWTLGFNFVLYLAGLQDIPRELYDAAAVDGARPWHQLWSVTVPLLGRTTTLVAVLQVIASLKVFDQIYLLLTGGPNYETRPAIEYIYDVGFTGYRVGYASAVSVVFFLIILAISIVWFRIVRRQEREG